MELRRVVLSIVVVLAMAVLVGCCRECPEPPVCPECPEMTAPSALDTKFVVIVPPEPGEVDCRIVPDPRHVGDPDSLTFVNLSDEHIKIEVSADLTDTKQPTLVFYLDKDESKTVPLKDAPDGEYIYSIEGPTGGCMTGLPSPRVIIP